jgi:hypothetical protein
MSPDFDMPLGAETIELNPGDDAAETHELAISLARRGASDALIATLVGDDEVVAVREEADAPAHGAY